MKRENSTGESWEYAGSIIYRNDTLYQAGTPEGRAIMSNGIFLYEFEYRDHLGNLRLSLRDTTTGDPTIHSVAIITQVADYYPFGMQHSSYTLDSLGKQKFQFSNYEREEEFGLANINFGQRVYNPTIGRFDKNDRFSEIFEPYSPYSFTFNSPTNYIEIYGDSSIHLNDLNWSKFNVDQDEILLNETVIRASDNTPGGTFVMNPIGFFSSVWNGPRTYYDGRMVDRYGELSNLFPPVMGNPPDLGIGRVGSIYKAVKNGLPYIGKTFNILKRYTNTERLAFQVEVRIQNINGNNKLIRAIEQ